MSLKKIQLRHFPPGINLIIKEKNNKIINKELNLYGIQNVEETQLQSYIQQNLIPQQEQILRQNLIQFTKAIKSNFTYLIHRNPLKSTQKHSRKYHPSSILLAHKQPLTTGCFSKYGDFFITASYDRTCKLWQTQTNSLITTLSGHMNAVFTVDISEFNNKRLIATGSLDKTIKIWGVNGKLFHKLIGHEAEITKVQFNPNGQYILSSSMDGVVKVWDIQKGRKILDLKGHNSEVVNFSHNYQGDQVISAGFNNTPIIFDLKNGQIVHKLEGQHDGEATCCKFQFTGEQCATAGSDKKCIIWDVGSGQSMQILQNHQKQILDLDFSPNGSKLATASSDSSICLYNVNLGALQHKLHGHQRQVNKVKFNSQGDFILSTGFDGIGRIWDSNTGENIDLLQGHTEEIYSCDVSYYGDKLLTCSKDGKCIVWKEKIEEK